MINHNEPYNIKNMHKGINGEFIISYLLQNLGYKVFRYGHETRLQDLFNIGKTLIPCDTKDRINAMPDFLVISPKGKMILIEVKLRTKSYSNIPEEQEKVKKIKKYYPECLLVVIDGENGNPIKTCYVSEDNFFDNLKPFRNFLIEEGYSEEKKEKSEEIITSVENLAQEFIEKNK